jgi:hypothetical protein
MKGPQVAKLGSMQVNLNKGRGGAAPARRMGEARTLIEGGELSCM